MFFIVNHENSIIAADTDFLTGIGAENIYEAALFIKKGEVNLDEQTHTISCLQYSKPFTKKALSTIIGEAFLYEVIELPVKESSEEGEAVSDHVALQGLSPEETNEENSTLIEADFELLELPEDAAPSSLDIQTAPSEEESAFSFSLAEEDTVQETTAPESILSDGESLDLVEPEERISETAIAIDTEETVVEEPIALSESEDDRDDLLSIDSLELPELHFADESSEEIAEKSMALKENIETLETNEITEPMDTETDIPSPLSETEKEDKESTIAEEDTIPLKLSEEENTEEILSVLDNTADRDISGDKTEIFAEENAAESDQEEEHPDHPTRKFQINFQEIAEIIGVTETEYTHFLEDFTKESLLLEPNLRSNDLKESRDALTILKEASLLLHLPQITEQLNALSNATSDEKSLLIDSYMEMTSQINKFVQNQQTTDISAEEETLVSTQAEEEETHFLEDIPETDTAEIEIFTEASENDLIRPASLDDVQPIPFEFSINEAADELTLPASLVSEFIVDFIGQAKENLPLLQKAYEQKDLEAIQTTAHMLKGASSNLRIVPMAETLYKLQFNEDITHVPELIALFSGQLKALSIQMNQA